MADFGFPSEYGLENHGLQNLGNVYWTLPMSALLEHAVRRGEGVLAEPGTFVASTTPHTGRSPNDKFTVQIAGETDDIWWGRINAPISEAHFDRLHLRVRQFFQGRDVFVRDAAAGAHGTYRLPIRVVNQNAWQNLFAHHMFLRLPNEELAQHVPEFTILHAPACLADPAEDGTKSGTFIVINFRKKLVLIGGTRYAGEIKKSIFTLMNYLLPKRGVMAMHCSATLGSAGDTALFFGLSGTGKTTLSSDPERGLIGDDEHGWGDDGVFNFEGGCYAKTIKLSQEYEPIIWDATHQYGSILENVTYDENSRTFDFNDGSVTENTRSAYPIYRVNNYVASGRGGHPTNIFFLTADAFGVLPPIARLTTEQAMYWFISGYTSKLAGTERGVTEPTPNFSACFGAPFLPLHPRVYAELLGRKITQHNVNVWLLNTGWTGGKYGTGKRMHLPYTRAMVRAALNGSLNNVSATTEKFFGLAIPDSCPGVPAEILNPRNTWADKAAYDAQARDLVGKFEANFQQFKGDVSAAIAEAGPSLAKLG
jgi:phosphoenolpyruvate carboxykinase (ATP)